MTGLNDNYLIADDSMEPKETPALVVHAFKDTPGEDGEPELRDDIDLIAAATEELSVKLRDLDLLQQSIKSQGGMSQSLALEAQAIMPGFVSDDRPLGFFTKNPSRTMLSVALEDIENEKKSVIAKIWDTFIAFLKKIYQFVVNVFSGIDLKAEKEIADKARKVAENRLSVDFVNEVVNFLPKSDLAVIAAIEESGDFMKKYEKSIEVDRNIHIPNRIMSNREIAEGSQQATELSQLTMQLNASIAQAMSMDDEDRERPLRQTLGAGTSINGSEHAAYFNKFFEERNNKQRFEELLRTAESYRRSYGPEEEVAGMRKIATALSQQFVMELKVVHTFRTLNRALLEVNEKIHQGT